MNILSHLIEHDMGERGRLLRVNVSVPDRPGSLYSIAGIIAGKGANVLQIFHDRSFSTVPGNVDITFLAEVRNSAHKQDIVKSLREMQIEVREI